MAAPILKYPGSKWRMAARIVAGLPDHDVYLEPFFGSGAVLFTKGPSRVETINDIDGRVVNLFRILRDRPDDLIRAVTLTPWARGEYEMCRAGTSPDALEDARRVLVCAWQSYGATSEGRRAGWCSNAGASTDMSAVNRWLRLPERLAAAVERLRHVQIEQQAAIDLIERYAHTGCLVYADPPYPLSTRSGRLYGNEMTDDDHRALLEALDAHPGPVVLSGYGCPLYDDRLGHWQREEIAATAEGGRARTEIIWRNAKAARPRLFA